MSNIISIGANADAIELIENVLINLRSGDVVAIGVVAVGKDGSVSTAWSDSNSYHLLNSGAARLAASLSAS
jgi:hypothetical protein